MTPHVHPFTRLQLLRPYPPPRQAALGVEVLHMVMAALAPSFGLLACGALLADAGPALLRWHVAFWSCAAAWSPTLAKPYWRWERKVPAGLSVAASCDRLTYIYIYIIHTHIYIYYVYVYVRIWWYLMIFDDTYLYICAWKATMNIPIF